MHLQGIAVLVVGSATLISAAPILASRDPEAAASAMLINQNNPLHNTKTKTTTQPGHIFPGTVVRPLANVGDTKREAEAEPKFPIVCAKMGGCGRDRDTKPSGPPKPPMNLVGAAMKKIVAEKREAAAEAILLNPFKVYRTKTQSTMQPGLANGPIANVGAAKREAEPEALFPFTRVCLQLGGCNGGKKPLPLSGGIANREAEAQVLPGPGLLKIVDGKLTYKSPIFPTKRDAAKREAVAEASIYKPGMSTLDILKQSKQPNIPSN